VRATPAAALYEAGRIHHVGAFAELEDQMCNFDGAGGGKSPDRMDALVWALAELFPLTRRANPRIRNI
jgi:phage terminase large subunit-like protein